MINIRRTVVSSNDENTVGGRAGPRDSRVLHLRQERGGRLEMARLDSIAPKVGPPPATWTAFDEPLGY